MVADYRQNNETLSLVLKNALNIHNCTLQISPMRGPWWQLHVQSVQYIDLFFVGIRVRLLLAITVGHSIFSQYKGQTRWLKCLS